MSQPQKNDTTARCSCGSVELGASGAPIVSLACYCDDCQEGSRQLEALPNAHSVREPDGGTEYVLYRKDRIATTKGAPLLKSYKLREKSASNRVIASCCNSAMFMSFDDSRHWVPVYRARLQGDVPGLQMRICTKFKADSSEVPSDVPSYRSYPFKFITKLVSAQIAMLFGR